MDLNIIKILCALFVTEVRRTEKNKDPVSEDTDVTKSDAPVFLNAESGKIKVGMYYYAEDKTFSWQIVSEKQVSGVVGYVDTSGCHGLVVMLHDRTCYWTKDVLPVGMTFVDRGKENTKRIWTAVKRQGISAEAACYCAMYAENGIKAGEAFLPSKNELYLIFQNFNLINASLKNVHGARIMRKCYHWSSSENGKCFAWSWGFNEKGKIPLGTFENGFLSPYDLDKDYTALTRPVVAF